MVQHRSSDAAFIPMTFTRPWRVLLPTVYRYLDAKYVEAFFADGELRLSSVSNCRKHPDEVRGDLSEGSSMVGMEGGGRSFGAWITSGQNEYILCGAMVLSKELLSEFSGADAAIQIDDVVEFARCVADQLAGSTGGMSGACSYVDTKYLIKSVSGDPFPLPKDGGTIPVEDVLMATQRANLGEDRFLKHRRFVGQAEYRFVWSVDHPAADYITIKAPEARRFCRALSAEEIP